jgi:hypothetical protein
MHFIEYRKPNGQTYLFIFSSESVAALAEHVKSMVCGEDFTLADLENVLNFLRLL